MLKILSEAEIYDNRTKKYHRVMMKMHDKCEKKYLETGNGNDWNPLLKFMADFNKKYPIRVEGTFVEELQRL